MTRRNQAFPEVAENRPPRRTAAKHVFFSWRSLEDVNYPRFTEDGTAVPVAPSKAAPPTMVPLGMLLKTAALDCELPVYVRCSLYEHRGCCDAGPRCRYVHMILVDPLQDAPHRRHRSHGHAAVAASIEQHNTFTSRRGSCDSHFMPSRASSEAGFLDCDRDEDYTSSENKSTVETGYWRHDPYSLTAVRASVRPA